MENTNPKWRVALGGDHAALDLKNEIIVFLKDQGHEVTDYGPNSTDVCDYPDYAHPVCNAIEEGKHDFGVLICGSGIGISIAANRHKGIRAALVWNSELAEITRKHNNSNVICLGARFVAPFHAKKMVETFLNAPFDEGIHVPRLAKLNTF